MNGGKVDGIGDPIHVNARKVRCIRESCEVAERKDRINRPPKPSASPLGRNNLEPPRADARKAAETALGL